MEADFVIVGSGSSGSALASRLSESGKHSVLVLEYGGTDIGPLIQMPAALSYPMNMKQYDWGYKTEPEPHLGGRQLACPRGKVIGGSSSINGMVYVRGHARDYDHWSESGADGWSYADVLPYFKRLENWTDGGHGGDPDWRGKDGPLHVSRGPRKNPLFQAFVDAGAQAGYELTDDYNGQKQEGFGPMEATIFKGRRWSTANAYLRPALNRKNLDLIRCFARRIVIEDGRATGVEIERSGKIETVKARREVILSASSINSPQLLMLSGIGPAAHLAEHNIPLLADRPGVGANLQDHLELYVQQACIQPITLYKHWNLMGKGLSGLEWLMFKLGLGASNQFESAAFVRLRATVFKPMWVLCAPPPADRSRFKATTPKRLRKSSSTICPSLKIGRISEPASASPARYLAKQHLIHSAVKKFNRERRCNRIRTSTHSSKKKSKAPIIPAEPAKWAVERIRWRL